VTTLLADGLIAVLKLTDRAFTAVENVLHFRPTPRAVDGGARPAGAGAASAAAGTGGHPIRATSELLEHARYVIVDIFELDKTGGIGPCCLLVRDLADRAAQFRAEGD
jgi:hypothetical protein